MRPAFRPGNRPDQCGGDDLDRPPQFLRVPRVHRPPRRGSQGAGAAV